MKPWMIIVLIVVVVLIAAGTTFIILSLQNNNNKEEVDAGEIIDGPIYQLGEFTVNVPYQRTTRFIRTAISLRITESRVTKDLNDRKDQIRDTVITILRQAGEEAIEDPEARVLRQSIKDGINDIIGSQTVIHVYFTEFVIQ